AVPTWSGLDLGGYQTCTLARMDGLVNMAPLALSRHFGRWYPCPIQSSIEPWPRLQQIKPLPLRAKPTSAKVPLGNSRTQFHVHLTMTGLELHVGRLPT
ncbi:MAG: hypothetical protein MUF54_18560, partial [Polyangiaceae bacterium]|nr:hypothetical protein [Polyangiaceae bacterium]